MPAPVGARSTKVAEPKVADSVASSPAPAGSSTPKSTTPASSTTPPASDAYTVSRNKGEEIPSICISGRCKGEEIPSLSTVGGVAPFTLTPTDFAAQ